MTEKIVIILQKRRGRGYDVLSPYGAVVGRVPTLRQAKETLLKGFSLEKVENIGGILRRTYIAPSKKIKKEELSMATIIEPKGKTFEVVEDGFLQAVQASIKEAEDYICQEYLADDGGITMHASDILFVLSAAKRAAKKGEESYMEFISELAESEDLADQEAFWWLPGPHQKK